MSEMTVALGDPARLVSVAAFVAMLLACAWSDARAYRIPNRLVAGIVLIYPAFCLAAPEHATPLAALLGAAIGLAVGYLAFCMNLFGAGDGKLLAAVLLWAGPDAWLFTLLITGLFGGVLAFLMATSQLASPTASAGWSSRWQHVRGLPVPYGVAIAMAGLTLVPTLLNLPGGFNNAG